MPQSPTRRPGRPRALDETRRAEICALVTNGCGIAGAARYVGCDVTTIRREARRNPEFGERLRHALRDAELAPLNAIREAAKNNWRAGVWLLEHADTQRFGNKDARAIKLDQLKEFTDACIQVLVDELKDWNTYAPLTYILRQLYRYCEYEIICGHDPFPIPKYVRSLDDSHPASATQQAKRKTQTAPVDPTLNQSTAIPSPSTTDPTPNFAA